MLTAYLPLDNGKPMMLTPFFFASLHTYSRINMANNAFIPDMSKAAQVVQTRFFSEASYIVLTEHNIRLASLHIMLGTGKSVFQQP
jgi:hypothetical protein